MSSSIYCTLQWLLFLLTVVFLFLTSFTFPLSQLCLLNSLQMSIKPTRIWLFMAFFCTQKEIHQECSQGGSLGEYAGFPAIVQENCYWTIGNMIEKTSYLRQSACCRSSSVGLASSLLDGLLQSTYPVLLYRGVENKKNAHWSLYLGD